MTPHIPEEFSTRLIDWSPFVIIGNTMPRAGRRLEHDAFRIGHSLSFGNSWRIRWA
jgi:hypothetical protein